MGTSKRRRSDRTGRLPMPSPGRPPVGQREHRQRFWEAIARGTQARIFEDGFDVASSGENS